MKSGKQIHEDDFGDLMMFPLSPHLGRNVKAHSSLLAFSPHSLILQCSSSRGSVTFFVQRGIIGYRGTGYGGVL